MRGNASKAVLKMLGQERKLSLLGFGFTGKKINCTEQYQSLPNEVKHLTWQVIFDSLLSLTDSNNLDLVAFCNVPAEIVLELSKSTLSSYCLADNNLFLSGFAVDSPFKQCASGQTIFAFRNKLINRLLRNEYPLSTQAITVSYQSA